MSQWYAANACVFVTWLTSDAPHPRLVNALGTGVPALLSGSLNFAMMCFDPSGCRSYGSHRLNPTIYVPMRPLSPICALLPPDVGIVPALPVEAQ